MTPKQFIKYCNWLDKKGYAICDGLTENINPLLSIANVLFAYGICGIALFLVNCIKLKTFFIGMFSLIGLCSLVAIYKGWF